MKFYGNKKSRRTGGAKRLRKSIKKVAKVSKPLKNYINRAIGRKLENKRFTIETADTLATTANATTFQSGNIWQLTPSSGTNSWYTIPQGLGEGSRVGNEISLKSATVRYAMYPLGYNVTSNPTPKPLDVMLIIFSFKRGVQGLTVLDAWNCFNTNIFCNGSSSNGAYGSLFDLVSVANSDVVTIHHRRQLKLGTDSTYLSGATVANYNNNDYKYNQIGKINITKYLPKKMTFNDSDNNSTSKQVFMIVSPINADGTNNVSTSFPMAVYSGLDLHYEDA